MASDWLSSVLPVFTWRISGWTKATYWLYVTITSDRITRAMNDMTQMPIRRGLITGLVALVAAPRAHAKDSRPSGQVQEAPQDGQTYGRRSGGWVTVGTGGGTTSAGVEAKNVRDFGAKGNAINDDRAAFVAAMAGGGLVRVPKGRYKISAPIIPPDGVTIRGDGHNGSAFQRGGCSLEAAFNEDFIFKRPSDEARHITLEHLGLYGWGGVFFHACTHLNINNSSFGCHQGIILPECWTSKLSNLNIAPASNEAGSVGILTHGSAGVLIDTVDVTAHDRGIILNGSGCHLTNFRMEVGNRGIVFGENLDGTKWFCNASKVSCGTMEANDRSINVVNAAYIKIENVLIQGHEHPGFGADQMCRLGIQVDNMNNSSIESVTANGGFSVAALVDSGGLQFANKYARCGFSTVLTVRDDVPAGASVIRVARGRATSMPSWLKVGLKVIDANANGTPFSYPGTVSGAIPAGTTVAAVGTDTFTLSRPTVGAMQGMVLANGLLGGRSALAFYDSTNKKVGGVAMVENNMISASMVEQVGDPFNVVP
jgi:hypothetical protein